VSDRIVIIAEAGVNHNGDLNIAKQLIDAAALSGADYVKFQTYITEELITPNAKSAEYQIQNSKTSFDSQYAMLKRYELSWDDHHELLSYSKNKGISFLSSAFDLESLHFLLSLELDFIKIPSGEINNVPYLELISHHSVPVILSTGMSTWNEIDFAMNILTKKNLNNSNITILQCTSSYPALIEDTNLLTMQEYGRVFGTNYGLSDHTPGIFAPQFAVAMGAKIIEKHLTLDKEMDGPDHLASLNPDEFKSMVDHIQFVKNMMGSRDKKPNSQELSNSLLVRKSIYAKKNIKEGEELSLHNITTKRPAGGISPTLWHEILGKKAKRCFKINEPIEI